MYRPKDSILESLRVPNTPVGRFFIFLLRKYVNRTTYDLKVRGRGPNRPKDLFINDIPLADAKEFAVYISPKYESGWQVTLDLK